MLPIGHKRVYLEETDSTNYQVYLLSRSTSLEHGFLMHTGFQHKGKTRNNNLGWYASPQKNVLMSFFLKPEKLDASRSFEISVMVCLALVRTLKIHGLNNIQIKWPNDIYSGGKKIAGILINNLIQGEKLNSSIVGIGLNVNEEDFPDFDYPVTSYALETGQYWNTEEVLNDIVIQLNNYYLDLMHEKFESRLLDFESQLLGIGKTCEFQFPNGELSQGILSGVDEFGRIRIQFADGEQKFQMGEIKQKIRS